MEDGGRNKKDNSDCKAMFEFSVVFKKMKALGVLVQILWLSEEAAAGFFLYKFRRQQFSSRQVQISNGSQIHNFEARDLPFCMVSRIIYIS